MDNRENTGTDRWSRTAIKERYRQYARQQGLEATRFDNEQDLASDGPNRMYPVMETVIAGIEQADPACIEIGIEYIEDGPHLPFGKILKSNAARALRQAALSEEQIERLRKRILGLLIAGEVPHEYKQYARLIRKIGIGTWWPAIEAQAPRDNPYVMRFYQYFKEHCA
jgi:hypothetical protein